MFYNVTATQNGIPIVKSFVLSDKKYLEFIRNKRKEINFISTKPSKE